MPLVSVTPPAVEPLTLGDTKSHLRIDDAVTADDGRISALIGAARAHVEKMTGRALITQTWDLVLDEFPETAVVLAKGRLQSVAAVTYLDEDGVEQVLDDALYLVDADSMPGRILPAYGSSWPATRDQAGAVRVRFAVGWGDAATNVPEDIRQAMLLLVGHWYENREAVAIAPGITAIPLPHAIEALLAPHMAW